MATRGHGWFDVEKLLQGESLIRRVRARLQTASPPGWWEGMLVLTTDRLFFLPDVGNPLVPEDVAYWLSELEESPAGHHRLRVHLAGSGDPSVIFEIVGVRAPGILGDRGEGWAQSVQRARRKARPAHLFTIPERRRAAG